VSLFLAISFKVGADEFSPCPECSERDQREHGRMRGAWIWSRSASYCSPIGAWPNSCSFQILTQLQTVLAGAGLVHCAWSVCPLWQHNWERRGATGGRGGENPGPYCLICWYVTAIFILRY